MPRRAIIAVLLILILGIVGGTALLLLQRLNSSNQTASTNPSSNGTNSSSFPVSGQANNGGPATPSNPAITTPGAQPPSTAPANSSLPPGGQVFPAANTPQNQQDEQVWAQLSKTNLTNVYNKTASDSQKSSTNDIYAFIQDVTPPISVPVIDNSLINVQPSSSSQAIKAYLDQIKDTKGVLNTQPIDALASVIFYGADPQLLATTQQDINAYKSTLLGAPVPSAAVEAHKLILGYVQRLDMVYQELPTAWGSDPYKVQMFYSYLQYLHTTYSDTIQTDIRNLTSAANV